MNNKITFVALFILIFTMGCVQMRDYTGIREGAFGLDIKKGFDEGGDKKDYCVVGEGIAFVIGDSKNEVIAGIGLPDKVETTLAGHESWIYEDRKINLFFKEDRFDGWNFF